MSTVTVTVTVTVTLTVTVTVVVTATLMVALYVRDRMKFRDRVMAFEPLHLGAQVVVVTYTEGRVQPRVKPKVRSRI